MKWKRATVGALLERPRLAEPDSLVEATRAGVDLGDGQDELLWRETVDREGESHSHERFAAVSTGQVWSHPKPDRHRSS